MRSRNPAAAVPAVAPVLALLALLSLATPGSARTGVLRADPTLTAEASPLQSVAATYVGPTSFRRNPGGNVTLTGFTLELTPSMVSPGRWVLVTLYRNGIEDDAHWTNAAGRPIDGSTATVSGTSMFIVPEQYLPNGTHSMVIEVYASLHDANVGASPLGRTVQTITVGY